MEEANQISERTIYDLGNYTGVVFLNSYSHLDLLLRSHWTILEPVKEEQVRTPTSQGPKAALKSC